MRTRNAIPQVGDLRVGIVDNFIDLSVQHGILVGQILGAVLLICASEISRGRHMYARKTHISEFV